jgi:hypothetical protein
VNKFYNGQLMFQANIRVNGVNCVETENTVYVPFGSEYSVFVVNKNTKRAICSITIDGKLVGDFIVNGGCVLYLEQFVDVNNKFKFLQATQQMKEYRNNPNDGKVKISMAFEREQVITRSMGMLNRVSLGGVTGFGSEGSQRFKTVAGFDTEPYEYVLELVMNGDKPTFETKPLTVAKCSVCGESTIVKDNVQPNFCSNCGSAFPNQRDATIKR